MQLIDITFLVYSFVSLYMLALFFFIYWPNRKKIYETKRPKIENVSIIVPVYNASSHISNTLDSLFKLNYPKEKIEIIVVDDHSTDNTVKIVKEYAKKYNNVRVFSLKQNSGRAAVPTNFGIKKARYDYIAILDDDTFPAPDSLLKLLAVLQEEERIAAVSCTIIPKNQKSWIQKMQAIEYDMTAFTRKLLDLIDSVYVTPGAFAMYKKEALVKIGFFDTHNMTQDIEIVWRLLSYGYKARMCLNAKAYTETPFKFRDWWKQRIRWNIGGNQTLFKYKLLIFRKGMLGNFIIPYFALSVLLAVVGVATFIYLLIRNSYFFYFVMKYSAYAGSSVLSTPFSSYPSIVSYFGMLIFILGLWMVFFSLGIMKYIEKKERKILNIIMFIFLYSMIYPLILIHSKYKMIMRSYKW